MPSQIRPSKKNLRKSVKSVEEFRMKSAYELAMERLAKGQPVVTLTDDQKNQLAEIDSQFKARIAEKELFLKGEIAKAKTAGKFEEI